MMKAVPDRRCARQQGITMIEILVVVAITVILASLAMPSFQDAIDKYRLKGAADALLGDLQFARMEAIKNNQIVFVNFATGASWCYGMKLGSACNCTKPATEADSCGLKQVSSASFPKATLTTATFVADPSFDPVRGLAAPAGNTVFQSVLGKQAQVNLSLIGKLDICSPAGVPTAGYPPC